MHIEQFKGDKLPLTYDKGLALFFVGVGSAFSKLHYQTNLLAIKKNSHIMIDFGTKASQGLYQLGLKVTDIENFIITHSHADHIGGLEEVILMGRYFAKKKPNILINEYYQNILWEMSLKGGCGFNEIHKGKNLEFEDFWNIQRPDDLPGYPRQTLGANFADFDIKMPRTMHVPEKATSWKESFWSVGVIIDQRVFYTSDTRYDPDLIIDYNRRFNFEYIFHDCQFFNGGVHASLEELNQLPAEIKAKTFLVHYSDNWEKFQHKVKEYGFIDLVKQHHFYYLD